MCRDKNIPTTQKGSLINYTSRWPNDGRKNPTLAIVSRVGNHQERKGKAKRSPPSGTARLGWQHGVNTMHRPKRAKRRWRHGSCLNNVPRWSAVMFRDLLLRQRCWTVGYFVLLRSKTTCSSYHSDSRNYVARSGQVQSGSFGDATSSTPPYVSSVLVFFYLEFSVTSLWVVMYHNNITMVLFICGCVVFARMTKTKRFVK
jgi:hypothetical protein